MVDIAPENRRMSLGRRRRRTHHSSNQMNQIEAQGIAYLCFAEDYSWFQGNINTDDDSNYSIYGERIRAMNNENKSEHVPEPNNNEAEAIKMNENCRAESNESLENAEYRVTLIDHFSGMTYTLEKIGVNSQAFLGGEEGTQNKDKKKGLFVSSESQVSFTVENVFRGQKADMIIQRHLGSGSLLGRKCLVFTGPITILLNEVIDNGRSWCL